MPNTYILKGQNLQKINIFTYFYGLLTPCGLSSPLASFLMASAEGGGVGDTIR